MYVTKDWPQQKLQILEHMGFLYRSQVDATFITLERSVYQSETHYQSNVGCTSLEGTADKVRKGKRFSHAASKLPPNIKVISSHTASLTKVAAPLLLCKVQHSYPPLT